MAEDNHAALAASLQGQQDRKPSRVFTPTKDTALQLDFQNGEDHVIQVRVKPHEMVVSVEAKGEKKGTITLSAPPPLHGRVLSVEIFVGSIQITAGVATPFFKFSSLRNAKAGGFIGFSCYGGSKDTYYPARERSAFVELKGLKATSLQLNLGRR